MNSLSTFIRVRPVYLKNVRNKFFATANEVKDEVKDEVIIPKRIPRGPTDILRALSSTIERDPTAAHYKYHDDPYLIPMSNLNKRSYALSQEAGRKAAHWIRKEHADLFQHKEADPPIELFFPKMVYNEDSQVTEEDLKNVIQNVLVSDASLVYKLLKEKKVDISNKTLQSFLELLCYYNSEDALLEEFIEERWFRQSSRGKERQRKTWKDGTIAEEIFISLENPDAAAYSAIIQGMGKYFQAERAWQLFEESQKKGFVLSPETYNSLISVASFLKEGYELRWEFTVNLLTEMKKCKVKPNVGTLNAVLSVLSTMGGTKGSKENALKVLSEFKLLKIEPSLASWYFILITYCKERGPKSGILYDVMIELENKEFKIQDLQDTSFFITAMDICKNHLHDKDLAKRVNKLLHTGNNYDLIGDSYKESIYYRHYFSLLCETEPFDEFMKNIYELLVPHIYIPEPRVMGEILTQLEMHNTIQYLPKLWSDIKIFGHNDREAILESVLNIMVSNQPEAESELIGQFSNIAWDIWTKIEDQDVNRLQKLNFTGDLLGNIMTLVLHNKEFDRACEVMTKLDKNQQSILGFPRIDAMSLFIDSCINEKAPTLAINCIQYCADNGFVEAGNFAIRLHQTLNLDERYLTRLAKIVGHDVLQQNVKAEAI